ncbi:TPA: glycoside hydrolase family 5 protein [Xanthomonas vasicola pv. zeae]|uniref:Endoglucanase n=2 Tax=Xanthomonas vasicola pv. vasculorum TaxID=325776 RepID=A0A836P598_XANVA|nr:glycoside hydrolase family 5 protein [Xanthomonas vasicola]AVQ05311.1 cellulase [Xanthomonas vasicola pv. vasculorum]AZM69506.1 cellulase [Xanthomonas vasicola pv. vasculorum]KFA24535.1 cellulase [Xanthomonas vasicola pv. vasculorum NCPPB 1326]KFA31628.1 cellulase [Xanthomonas vasicola pv. vasculorum NCPPB 1381]MBV6746878.1 glycoside hydrolase family 5 protein [Xanthomonas vasicola pv. vasculorum NCPPB 890]
MSALSLSLRTLLQYAVFFIVFGSVSLAHAETRALTYAGVNLSGAEFASSKRPGVLNKDYMYAAASDYTYFAGVGMNTIRLPILWERLQPTARGDLDPTQLALLQQAVARAKAAGMYLIIDIHNYAKYYGYKIGSPEVPVAAFTDLWRRLALEFNSDNAVMFGLMNEPNNISASEWAGAAQAAIDAIRRTGANNLILVPGTLWTGAHSWYSSTNDGYSNATALTSIYDPLDRYAFEVHQYLDADSSGTSSTCVSSTIGAERLRNFTQWLRTNRKRGFLAEFGSVNNAVCNQALKGMLAHMESNADVWLGWTCWGAGSWWNLSYAYNVHPNKDGTDKPQMAILSPQAAQATRAPVTSAKATSKTSTSTARTTR